MKNITSKDRSWKLTSAKKDLQSITSDWHYTNQQLIEGVIVKEIRPVISNYGYLTEIFRAEWFPDNAGVDQIFQGYFSTGKVSAWHAHEHTIDRLFVSDGLMQIVLFDNRPDSKTKGLLNSFRIGSMRPSVLVVPPKVWHGVKNIGPGPSILINTVDIAYQYSNPDHWRIPFDSPEIPFSFSEQEK